MGAQITCVGFRIGGWERLGTPDRIRARVELVERVRRLGDAPVDAVLAAGEVLVFVLRAEPARTIVVLVDTLRRHGAGGHGTRVGVAAGSAGPTSGAETVAETVRLLSRGQGHEEGEPFFVLLGELLHWHVRSASSLPRFERVRGDAFGPDYWVWPGGVPAATRGEPGSEPRGSARRARSLMRAGEHAAAAEALRAILRGRSGPEPLLALGECHLRLGERRAAVETWRYLLRRFPLTLAAYPLMDLTGPDDVARAYLADGLRIVRASPGLTAEPERFEQGLLLALAARAYRRGERRTGDRLVNEAAEVYPGGGAPLRVLAVEALRRGDPEAARRLLVAALARTPQEN